MKQTGFILAIAFLAGSVFGQPKAFPQPAAEGAPPGVTLYGPYDRSSVPPQDTSLKFHDPAMQAKYNTIKGYMRLPSPLKFGDQYLARLGDQAAFFLYGLITNRSPLTPTEQLTALDIIHKAFAKPKIIQNTGDRNPDGSLALLKLLQASAIDEAVKERIIVETNFLYSVPQTIVPDVMVAPGPPPEPGTTPFR